ncbi:unnamed protein product [Paramecium sonneborni]|uniref:Uncharacterized protein n=1 Tax=Paramecium sonneborni TaxID=65129 RepID=A0A8S1NAP3_9CILI|nr:unnamed protein product [Paramecium sonneborni]
MIKYKSKIGIQILFALKHLITASFSEDIYLIIISGANLIILIILLKKNLHSIWKYFRILLLLELSFFDHIFTPPIIATLNLKIKFKIVILVFYCCRVSLIYFKVFQIIDWVYLGILFISFIFYIYTHDSKLQKSKNQFTSERKLSYLNINSQSDQQDVFDLFNFLPFGICILDDKQNITNSNYKAKKYCSNIKEENFQSQLFMMISRACLQQLDKKSIFNSSEDQASEFQMRRLQSFSQTRKKAISQQRQFNNLIDISQIINKHKTIKGVSESCNQNSLKYRDLNANKTYEIKIYEITQGSMICIQNISKKERQFEIRERFRFQSLLINSFSHELKTPLNCSLSLLQILEQELRSDKIQQHNLIEQKYLKPAIISNKKLLHQINDILDYANFEAQTFQLRPTQFKISTLLQTIEYYFKDECQQKQINFIVQTCDDCIINNDFDRIIQILVNLLNNSVKFTKQNGQIQFNINRIGSMYSFEVFDTGCGISVEKLYLINKILQNQEMDILKRGDEDYIQYVGLGLKVSSQIAFKLCQKGELIITSSLNQFTKSRFYVQDLNTQEEILTIPTDEFIQIPYKSKTKKQCHSNLVLIVDDIPFNHLAFITVLKYFNIKCDSAYDGSMAIEMVKNKYDNCQCGYKLIFMDIDMPGIDGYQCSKEISQFLQQKNITSFIIMCSAFDSKDNIDIAYKSGMNDILPKPIDTLQLKKILSKYYF